MENPWRTLAPMRGPTAGPSITIVKTVFRIRNLWTALVLLALIPAPRATAQNNQLLPEIDVYYKLKPDVRLWFQAKETREDGSPVQAEIGPSLDFYLKPWLKLKNASLFDLDDSKSRPVIFSIGYRYLSAPDEASTNRLEPVVILNFPMKGRVLISDRNRADLNWQNGNFTWRYRNRITVERSVHLHGYHPSPYAMAEFFYNSQYGKWSDTALFAGCIFPIGRHVEFNPYYEHQNSTGPSPNQQLNQLGLMLNLFF